MSKQQQDFLDLTDDMIGKTFDVATSKHAEWHGEDGGYFKCWTNKATLRTLEKMGYIKQEPYFRGAEVTRIK